MIERFRLVIVTMFFAGVLYIIFAYKKIFPLSILAFVIPFSMLSYKEFEIGFIMVVIAFISALAAVKLNSASFIDTFNIVISVIAFYAVKSAIERKKILEVNRINNIKDELRKRISEIDSSNSFYEDYITKKLKIIDSTKRIISFLKDIENSSSEEEIMSKITKAIKMIFPNSSPIFVVSPYVSPVIEDVFRTKTPLFVPSTSKDTRYPKNVWKDEEKSVIVIPVIVFSKTIAVLSVSSQHDNYFTRDDFITIEIISNTASTTLENISLYRTLDNLARKDSLTGVFTRRIFDEKIEEEILVSARTKQPFCLFILDIDHFKRINDTYGHQVGDEVLKSVAKTILKNIREFDFLARYGGEEFAIIMPNTIKKNAVDISYLISKEINSIKFCSGARNFNVTISGGVGEFPTEGQSKTQIIRICDERLYFAKNKGRNMIVYE
ncbi:MAG: sensor domain-containing diguanylate cyclase [Elusimicrobiales bacterium]|nr:sensor domain-containing diguanylate cyclase [Elusimicrobiales bacterium]